MQRSYWSKPLDFRSYFVSERLCLSGKGLSAWGGLSLFYQRDGKFGDVCDPAVCCRLCRPGVKLSRSAVLQVGLQPSLYWQKRGSLEVDTGRSVRSFLRSDFWISPLSWWVFMPISDDIRYGRRYLRSDRFQCGSGMGLVWVWVFCISYHRIH